MRLEGDDTSYKPTLQEGIFDHAAEKDGTYS